MKKLLFIVASIVLLLIGISFVLMKQAQNKVTDSSTGGDSFVSTSTNTFPASDDLYIQVKNKSLQDMKSYNFLQAPGVTQDDQNPGYYYLGNTVATPDASYVVQFQKETGFFTVTLLKEPLKESRLEAEKYLKGLLDFSEQQFCTLNYSVAAPIGVSEEYSGVDLKFSFCPGSVQL